MYADLRMRGGEFRFWVPEKEALKKGHFIRIKGGQRDHYVTGGIFLVANLTDRIDTAAHTPSKNRILFDGVR